MSARLRPASPAFFDPAAVSQVSHQLQAQSSPADADLGGDFGITGSIDSTDGANTRAQGRLKMPLPPPAATMLRIRIRWEASGVIRMPWDASPPRPKNEATDATVGAVTVLVGVGRARRVRASR